MSPEEMYTILNKKSGMYALTGNRFADQRDVRKGAANGDELCKLALEVECYRIKKYIGAYMAALGRLDSIVFTAGVGERATNIREMILQGLETSASYWTKNATTPPTPTKPNAASRPTIPRCRFSSSRPTRKS